MSGRLRKVVSASFAALSLLAFSAPERSAHADARAEARRHFQAGMSEISDGKYDAGIDELERAYAILPHPNVLFNIARAYTESGDIDHALEYYRRYLETEPPDRDQVRETVARLNERVERQKAAAAAAAAPAAPSSPTAPTAGTTATTATTATTPNAGDPNAGPTPAPVMPAPVTPATSDVPKTPAPSTNSPPLPGAAAAPAKTEDIFAEKVVTASKGAESPLDSGSSTSIVTQQDIHLSGITKIPELLRRLAGVDVMEVTGADTEVSLRGFNQRLSNRVLVLVDGRSVFADFLGATFWQLLSIGVEDIERIEVVRGPGSALYGADAMNGVINIITKAPGEGKSGVAGAYGDHGMTHGSFWAAGKDGGFSWRGSAGYDALPRWSREVPDNRQDLHLSSADQNSSARTARIDFRATRDFSTGGSSKPITIGLGGGFVSGTNEVLGIGPLNDIDFTSAQTSDVTATLDSENVEARVFWNRIRSSFGLNAAPIGQSLLPGSIDQNVIDGEVQFKAKFHTGGEVLHDLRIGAGYRLKQVDWTYLDENRTENYESLFFHDDVKLGKLFAVIVDYRLDYVPYLAKFVQSPRAAALFHPSKTSTIRASIGTAFRTPTFLESYVNVPVQLPAAGGSLLSQGVRADDPSFKVNAEKNFSTELGYLLQGNDRFTLDTSLFYSRVSNLIELAANRPVTLGDAAQGNAGYDAQTGLYPLFYGGFDNECQAYDLYGAELGVRTFPVEGLDIYANYTLNLVHQDDSGCSAVQKSTIVEDARTSAHKLNVGAQGRTRFGIDAEIDFHYVSPETWGEQVEDVTTQRVDEQAFHLDAYTLLNARVGYRFFHDKAEISAVGFNLLGVQHREHPFGQLIGTRGYGAFSYRF